jgi:hypothetical protein
MTRCCGRLLGRKPRWRIALEQGNTALARYTAANPRDIRDIANALLKDITRRYDALTLVIQTCDSQLASVTMIQDIVIAAVQTLNLKGMHTQAAEIVR